MAKREKRHKLGALRSSSPCHLVRNMDYKITAFAGVHGEIFSGYNKLAYGWKQLTWFAFSDMLPNLLSAGVPYGTVIRVEIKQGKNTGHFSFEFKEPQF